MTTAAVTSPDDPGSDGHGRAQHNIATATLIDPATITEKEMRRIRAAQINSVARLVPITMTINVLNAGAGPGGVLAVELACFPGRLVSGDFSRRSHGDPVVGPHAQ